MNILVHFHFLLTLFHYIFKGTDKSLKPLRKIKHIKFHTEK